ncbi:MAG: glycosyltransferase family 4 protein [Verrucomicrobiota bacterium]|jgi:glycosyltransferase involved in cell wall biosynthesis
MAKSTLIAMALDYPLPARGGVGVIVESLLRYLAPEYRVLLISPDDPKELEPYFSASRISEHIRISQADLTRTTARGLADAIIQRGAALAHFHGGGNFTWGTRRGTKSPFPFLGSANVPVIFSAHQIGPLSAVYYPAERQHWFKLAFLPLIMGACTYSLWRTRQVITDSKHDANMLKRQFPLLARRINFIYHSRLDATENVAVTTVGRQKTVLSVGHVAIRKGQHVLAEAFSRIASRFPDWKLVIAGPLVEPRCSDWIERIRQEHHLTGRIQLIGSQTNPRELMQTAGVFVQPSLMEAFGLALQEAMFLGCACVGSNTGGIPELIADNQTGRLCAPGNPDALADALTDLLGCPEKRQRLGEAAHADIIQKGMTGQAMAANYEKIYRRVLPQHR